MWALAVEFSRVVVAPGGASDLGKRLGSQAIQIALGHAMSLWRYRGDSSGRSLLDVGEGLPLVGVKAPTPGTQTRVPAPGF